MARRSKPWFRKQTGWWMVTVGDQQHKLAQGRNNKAEAEKRFNELMFLRGEAPESSDARVVAVCEAFLQWSRHRHAADTYRNYQFYIQNFCEKSGYLKVSELKPFHVTRWVDSHEWNDTSEYNARRTVYRAFNWAAEEQLIPKNPLKGMKRPKPMPRQRALTDDEYRRMLRASDGCFRVFLFALRETGARPKEVRDLMWEQVQTDRWVFRDHKTAKKTRKPRIIYLTKPMVRLMEVLRRRSSSQYVFVNGRGKPWTLNAVRLRVQRLKKKLGLAKDVCSYMIRHSYGTYAVLNGVDVATVAELMGHVDTTMVSTVYVHLADQADHLKEAAHRAVRPSRPASAKHRAAG